LPGNATAANQVAPAAERRYDRAMSTIHLYDVTASYPLDVTNSFEHSISLSVRGFFGGSRRLERMGMAPGSGETEPARAIALNKVNLEIRHGETMGVLGPSGCGKTTLLRVIAGLMPIDDGLITYDGQDISSVPVGDRRIGIVFQNYALYPTMTSRENVGFFFRIHKRDREIPERIREVSQVMGIGFAELLDKRPPWLSGGQRQRVALARCIARDPKLFLFDEPLSNLDAKLRVKTRAELKRLIARYKVTGVYVTHDQIEALSLCDRLAVMNEGRIEQVGLASQLLERPVSTVVATCLGLPPMNLFAGELTDDGWQSRHDPRFRLPLPGHLYGYHSQVTLGVRAEHLRLDILGSLTGEVVLVEPQMADRTTLVYIDSYGQRITSRIPQEERVRLGDVITLAIDPAYLHLFDTRTGRRL
jgi:multiple sugar transport system ATP-binding protein